MSPASRTDITRAAGGTRQCNKAQLTIPSEDTMNAMNGHPRDGVLTLAPFPSLRQGGPVLEWPQPSAGPVAEAAVETPAPKRRAWPLAAIAAPAAVAIWSGWVGLGGMCGFGLVQPLPGIVSWHLNTAITLPVGIESYGAYALYVWLGESGTGRKTRKFARRSAIGAGALGCLGQVAFHLMAAAGWARAPWYVVMLVACLPVITLFFAATLTHLIRGDAGDDAGSAEIASPALADDGPDETPDEDGEDFTGPSPEVQPETPERLHYDLHEAAAETFTDADAKPSPQPSRRLPKRASGRDRAIALLKKNGTLTDKEVAKRAGVSETTAWRARRDMEGTAP